jgi:hypothetical protein
VFSVGDNRKKNLESGATYREYQNVEAGNYPEHQFVNLQPYG